jgi:hypothetical protein
MSYNLFPLVALVSYQPVPFNHERYLDILYTYIMSFHDNSTDELDPYFGLNITWMDSPLSEWLQTSTIDEIDEAVAPDGVNPKGLGPPGVRDAAASCSL